MTPERYQRIGELFDKALERAPEARAAFLDQACGADDELRIEVEKLLVHHSNSNNFLYRPAMQVAATLMAHNQTTSALGKQLGHYQILSLLGAGGMGVVYLAEDARLRRKIALKVLPESIAQDQNRLHRFEQEAFAASALNHPNILTIYEFGREGERHYLAAEFIEGETLRARLQRAHLSLDEVLDIAMQTAQALAAAHAVGIIHRDIKPENIMLRSDGLVKVLDFGLAKLAEASQDSNPTDSTFPTLALPGVKTNLSAVMGTPNYMSPEQARGLAVDVRTDVFSLGIVLYEMLSGKTPFAGETAIDVIAEILKSEPVPLGSLVAGLPRELELIVEKTLRKNREERYQTIKDLFTELRDFKSELDFQIKLERSTSTSTSTTGEMLLKPTDPQRRVPTNENLNERTLTAEHPTFGLRDILEQMKLHKLLAVFIVSGLLIGFVAFSINRYVNRRTETKPLRAASEPMKQTRLTTTGTVSEAKISPDGQSVAYIAQQGAQYAIYLWQADENRIVTVLPPADDVLNQLDFAPDGQHLYYLQMDKAGRDYTDLYKVPTLGGAPEKIIAHIVSIVSFSPDGRQLAFRREEIDRQHSVIYIANADGTGERVIAERAHTEGFAYDPAWSPDGKTIVSWVNEAIPDLQEFSLVAINIADGSIAPIGSSKWRWPGTIKWMPDGKELLVNGLSHAGELHQIFRVAYPSGEVLRVTNDFNKYEGVSVTADGVSLVTVQSRQDVNMFVALANEPMNLLQITAVTRVTYYGLAWTPDGRIVYSSNAGGKRNLWIMEANGSRLQQITNNNFVNYNPVVTPDGRYIVYQCEQTGRSNIWRINLDGSNPFQLTNGDIEQRPSITPDSQWVVYEGKKDEISYLGKISINGSEPQVIVPTTCAYPKVSPDGKTVACEYWVDNYWPSLAIIPIDGGQPIKSFLPRPSDWQWATDSRSLILVDHTQGFSNLFRASLVNDARKPLTNFKSDHIFSYAYSPDGKKIAIVRGSVSNEVVMISNFH